MRNQICITIFFSGNRKKSGFEKIMAVLKMSWAKKAILFVSPILNVLPRHNKKIPDYISFEKGKIRIIFVGGNIWIPYKSVKIVREEERTLKVTFEVEDLSVDKIIETLASEKLCDNEMICSLICEINKATEEKEKMQLLQFLLNWINRNGVLKVALDSLEDKCEWAKKLKALGIENGKIEIGV